VRKLLALGFAFLFLLGSLLPRSNFRELEKIPSMINHFEHHKKVFDKNLTFAAFLLLHFSPGTDHNEPSHQTELPLQNGIVASFAFTLPQHFSLAASLSEMAIQHFKPFSASYQFQYTSAWFQPPQVA